MYNGINLNQYRVANFIAMPIFIIFILCYGGWNALSELFDRLNGEERYSHGFLIPFVVIYLIQQRWHLVQQKPLTYSWIGTIIVFLASILYALGNITVLLTIVQYSIFFILMGCILSLIGWQAIRVILIPLSLLLLSIPLPFFLDTVLSGKLQLLSSKLGVDFIRFCDIPVYLEGNVIDLGAYKLQVVEACSGLNYLYPLMSIGLICAYIYNDAGWKKAIIFLSTIPITIGMNSFRIGIIGILVNNFGIEAADGFLHYFEGWVIFMLCTAILLLEMKVMSRASLSEIFSFTFDNPTVNQSVNYNYYHQYCWPLFASALIISISVVSLNFVHYKKEYIPARKDFRLFPTQINKLEYIKRSYFENNENSVLKASDYILSDYRLNNKNVNLFIAYYESQRTGASPHSPRACIPGGGWEIASIERINLTNKLHNNFAVNKLIIQKGEAKQLVYYWFQLADKAIANEYTMKWQLFKNSLLLNRSDGGLVRLTTEVYSGESIYEAEARLNAFIDQLSPLLPIYLPH